MLAMDHQGCPGCSIPLQVVLPVARTAEGPVGLALIGPRGADEALLDFAVAAMAAIQAGRKQ
jgi:Asp-tRNA(Asn)/Glu-tRNA(Gln) amidotransferase A subunit family amidase